MLTFTFGSPVESIDEHLAGWFFVRVAGYPKGALACGHCPT